MPVYVDNMRARVGPMVMCHMVADTEQELHEMADRIGMDLRWYQYPAKSRHPHYDIGLGMRARAVAAGAIEITRRVAPAITRRCLAAAARQQLLQAAGAAPRQAANAT